MSSYSIDDPWTSNANGTNQEATSSSSRPLTWAPSSAFQDQSKAAKQDATSDINDDVSGGIRLPDLYEKTWRMCQSAEHKEDGDISLGQLGKLVRSAQGLQAADVERIIDAVCSSSSTHCTKKEFATALLLIAQVQAGEEIDAHIANQTLISGDDLAEPILDLNKLQSSTSRIAKGSSTSTNRSEDPWTQSKIETKFSIPSNSSTFATSALRGWQEGDAGRKSPLHPPVYIDPNPCSVHLLPELGGFLFFRHVLYLVKSPISNGVKRRYNDFVSLHEYLITRYPFRLVPPLPPKRLSLPHMSKTQVVGSGQQDAFLEQRRLSLARYSRNVISHPVFHKDDIVMSFFSMGKKNNGLSEENSSTWKISVASEDIVEEGLDESWKLSDSEIMGVPVNMEEKLDSTKKHVSMVVDRWNNTVAVFERQARRMEATAAEATRLSLSLSSLLEVEIKTFRSNETEDRFGQSTELLISNSQDYSDLSTARYHTLQRTLDALKNARDVWVSLKELFKRHEKLGGDPIKELTSRIEINRKRWKTTIEEKKANWQELCTRLKEEIVMDQKLIERYERRNKKVRVAIWHEITRLQYLKNLIIVDWKTYAKSEAINLAASKQASEELVVALDSLTSERSIAD